ncbi:MAG TPA: cysteine methyltransferase [Marinilabiliales bacterium]|nr:cysteine methyltransferase [Marinilabiliales bacterium]
MALKQKTPKTDAVSLLRFETPIGTVVSVASAHGIESVSFTDEDSGPKPERPITDDFEKFLHPLKSQLEEYFEGKRKTFELALAPSGTPFQQKAWDVLQRIPYGETRTYQQQTGYIGDPKAIRAVASANGKNPVAIVIPCHRVIGTDGSLTGYAGGLWRKKWLLEHEHRFTEQKGQLHIEFPPL